MQNRKINPETVPPPGGHYTHAIEVAPGARWMVVSGQTGNAADGSIPKDMTAQADNAWTSIVRILEANGMRVPDIVKINHFLTRREDFAAYNAVRLKYLGDHKPASTLLYIGGLANPDFLVEVEVTAAKSMS
jgi:enamine deaminase RidA (YjgF/YER057c/UK114 family)